MIAYDQALHAILDVCRPLAPPETVPVDRALCRVLAQDVIAGEDLPPFDNSAMDGFALASGGDELIAGREFAIVGSQAAGDGDAGYGAQACEIMTGASLPAGLDAVVPVEYVCVLARNTDGHPQRIRLKAAVLSGAHVRNRGQDVARGQRVLVTGQRITSAEHMLLAALGVAEVQVRTRVPTALFTTGRELVDDPRQPLAPGQIRNSNGPYLTDRLHEAGASVVHRESVTDDPRKFSEALARGIAAGARIVLSTGAVSMGRHDFVPDALRALGAGIVFHKVAIRPGKPLLFARLAGGQLYFGLPGNPVSGAVGLRFFVEPALRELLGQAPERPLYLPLAEAVHKKAGLRYFQKAQVLLDAQARLWVRLLHGQESFRIQSLVAANAWAALDQDAEQLPAGTPVEVCGLDGRGILFPAMEESDGN